MRRPATSKDYEEMAVAASKFFGELYAERRKQLAKFGHQSYDWPGGGFFIGARDQAKVTCEAADKAGRVNWIHIITEEFYEACAETDPVALRAELIQLAAVALAAVQDLDAKEGK